MVVRGPQVRSIRSRVFANFQEWAPDWSDEEIADGRAADRVAKQRQFGGQRSNLQPTASTTSDVRPAASGGWAGVKNWVVTDVEITGDTDEGRNPENGCL